ncbi:MAG: ABC transporter ATP-binding protein [Cytophagales bacterium]|nr:ABC transporter ATP-binding protein [Cytophagales bacterium]
MSDSLVKVEGIGKRYKIGRRKSAEMRETFSNFLTLLKLRTTNNKFYEDRESEFWALKDISFQINEGEAVGIIGRNGAGKSTLLKLLSRITKPTTGRFEIHGRVGSLLEVGTGFHPELTGRENIYLNGTILGMRRAEIKSKFDEIITFSGVEEFIDTPVKHYSSGMKVRLAFSVAAHLEPEILIIDEVLAVGDAEFQKKCLGKMEDVTGQGRTVLFVSHNMRAVSQLCDRAILINEGKAVYSDKSDAVIEKYHEFLSNNNQGNKYIENYPLNKSVILNSFSLKENELRTNEVVEFNLNIESNSINHITDLSLLIFDDNYVRVGIVDLRSNDLFERSKISQNVSIKGAINNLPLIEGTYKIGIFIYSNLCHGNFNDLLEIKILPRNSDFLKYSKSARGIVDLNFSSIVC